VARAWGSEGSMISRGYPDKKAGRVNEFGLGKEYEYESMFSTFGIIKWISKPYFYDRH
jgi:hypothetical protein